MNKLITGLQHALILGIFTDSIDSQVVLNTSLIMFQYIDSYAKGNMNTSYLSYSHDLPEQ